MSLQRDLSLIAASIGFVSAVFFCIGSIFNTPKDIAAQSATYWDQSDPVAHSLVAEQAQYLTGGLLLVISFAVQVLATIATPTKPSFLPQKLHPLLLVLVVVLVTSAVATPLYLAIEKTTASQVLSLQATPAR